LSEWAILLVGWDGLVPFAVLLIPIALSFLFGGGTLIEISAVVIPIVAYLWRAAVGLNQISNNRCSMVLRKVQYTTLFFGLLLLLIADAFVILTWGFPDGALSMADYYIAGVFYLAYLSLMAFSLFPGFRSPSSNAEWH